MYILEERYNVDGGNSGVWCLMTSGRRLARRLYLRDKNALAAEWEAVVLHALSKLGSLSYQPETGGSRRFDGLLKLQVKPQVSC